MARDSSVFTRHCSPENDVDWRLSALSTHALNPLLFTVMPVFAAFRDHLVSFPRSLTPPGTRSIFRNR